MSFGGLGLLAAGDPLASRALSSRRTAVWFRQDAR